MRKLLAHVLYAPSSSPENTTSHGILACFACAVVGSVRFTGVRCRLAPLLITYHIHKQFHVTVGQCSDDVSLFERVKAVRGIWPAYGCTSQIASMHRLCPCAPCRRCHTRLKFARFDSSQSRPMRSHRGDASIRSRICGATGQHGCPLTP